MDLDALCSSLKSFLENNDYEIEELEKLCFKAKTGVKRMFFNFTLKIDGQPDDFEVTFSPGRLDLYPLWGLMGKAMKQSMVEEFFDIIDERIEKSESEHAH